ncbi:RES family NAD+ phosphorylase [soil metagenome]
MLDGLPIVREAYARTVRLVSTARLRPSVLRALVDEEDLSTLAEIEGATSARLRAQERGLDGVHANEFVFGIPQATFINAGFAYAKPRELNRFNGPGRGAWYAALSTETCLSEVQFHMTEFLERTGDFHATVEYAEMFASIAGEFVDLRTVPHPCLNLDPAIGYPIGNALADAAIKKALNGIIYPSVRHSGGTCFAVLWPHAVQSVALGDVYRMVWSGDPKPAIEKA